MRWTILVSAIALALSNIPAARAGLYDDIYRGLQIFATPSGFPLNSTGDGARVNGQRSGRVRITPNVPGRGFELDFDRTFGVDSSNRPETLNLGMVDLTLAGATRATLEYTSRGDFFTGSGQVSATNLNYQLRGKTGVQDFDLTGQFNLGGTLEVNQLGFYTLNFNASNTNSTLKVDGVAVQGSNPTNFDIGPISVKGNVFLDAWVGLLDSLGVDTTALDPLVDKSGVNQIVDTIRNDLLNAVAQASVQASGDVQVPASAASSTGTSGAAKVVLGDSSSAYAAPGANSGPVALPEPSTLMLVSLGSALFWSWRRR